jgi:hypothetical protein
VDSQDHEKRDRELEAVGEVTAAQWAAPPRERGAPEDGGGDERQREEKKVEEWMFRDAPAPPPRLPLRRRGERIDGRRSLTGWKGHALLISARSLLSFLLTADS